MITPPKKSTDKVYEIPHVENPVVRYARSKGLLVDKFQSPSKRSVPDDIFTIPNEKRIALTFYIEFKAPGKKPTTKQKRDHEKRRKAGLLVYVIDNPDTGKQLVDSLICLFG